MTRRMRAAEGMVELKMRLKAAQFSASTRARWSSAITRYRRAYIYLNYKHRVRVRAVFHTHTHTHKSHNVCLLIRVLNILTISQLPGAPRDGYSWRTLQCGQRAALQLLSSFRAPGKRGPGAHILALPRRRTSTGTRRGLACTIEIII
jgi:hypothetical protein